MTDTQPQNAAVEQKPKTEAAEPKPQPLRPGNHGKQKYGYWWGTGRRKTSLPLGRPVKVTLTREERNLVEAWVRGGMERGDSAKAPTVTPHNGYHSQFSSSANAVSLCGSAPPRRPSGDS